MALALGWVLVHTGCAHRNDRLADLNSLEQQTGGEGSTVPKARPPFYPNTSGNIVAPPGHPGGNPAGAPPIVGGTSTNQTAGWPEGR
ncbi:MAG: hypothetical protein ICV75_01760 [Nitrospiraceae bacterium]|nr:hypothetical protein [Nitrospiraceae bacterium]